jgi:hypothetical protein
MASRIRRTPKSIEKKARGVFSVRFSSEELKHVRSEAKTRGGTVAGTVREIVMDTLGQSRARMIMLGANTTTQFHSSVRIHGLPTAKGEHTV